MRKKVLIIISFIVLFYSNLFSQWEQIGRDIVDSTYNFGRAVSLNSEGDILAAGNTDGAVAIFKNENEQWVQMGKSIIKDAAGSNAGWKISVNNSQVLTNRHMSGRYSPAIMPG